VPAVASVPGTGVKDDRAPNGALFTRVRSRSRFDPPHASRNGDAGVPAVDPVPGTNTPENAPLAQIRDRVSGAPGR
ncbi:MAG TPA: hypothetical protein VIM27_09245, partial [Gaiellales bacterium]